MAVVAPKTVLIPEGDCLMGSESAGENEAPVHRVWLDAFAMAITPVTRWDYAQFLTAENYEVPPFWADPDFQSADQPVVGVSWIDAGAYCDWLSRTTGQVFRLPTEAEWEKAARGGLAGRAYPWGDALPEDHLGGRDRPPGRVGAGPANGYGLRDMSGCVHEWCADFYDARYYHNAPDHNPKGPEIGERRVARGGSWRHKVRYTRCAARSSLAPDKHFSDFGFRCAMTPGPK
jgi:formylglycine-generating enzyme